MSVLALTHFLSIAQLLLLSPNFTTQFQWEAWETLNTPSSSLRIKYMFLSLVVLLKHRYYRNLLLLIWSGWTIWIAKLVRIIFKTSIHKLQIRIYRRTFLQIKCVSFSRQFFVIPIWLPEALSSSYLLQVYSDPQ